MTEKLFQSGGFEHVSAQIQAAVQDGSRSATIRGCWEIDQAIRIPSDFTLILENAHLRLADGVYSNIFVNEHHDTELGKTVEGRDRNITILGRGEAILDGGTYNGLSEKNHSKDGMPPIWKNNLLLFTNVDGFKISDLACLNLRWWALNFVYCCNGYLGNLDFCASDLAIDENGNKYHGLKREKYKEAFIKNADGIDLRQGCHDILIENITGFTEDDSVALTALNGRLERTFGVEGLSSDLCRITIRNVRTAAFCTNVRLLNQGGLKLYDVQIDGVYDEGYRSEKMNRGHFVVRIGDKHLYGDRHSTEEETYNISINDVCGGANDALIGLAGKIGNLQITNVVSLDETPLYEDLRSND